MVIPGKTDVAPKTAILPGRSLCPCSEFVHTRVWPRVCVHIHVWHSQYTTNPLRLRLAGKEGRILQIPFV